MPKLLYQGHGSFRLKTNTGLVVYVDPYAGSGYDEPADLILVSHSHSDHNQTQICAKKADCVILSNKELLKNGIYQTVHIKGITVRAVEAYNKNHNANDCVGFIITIDGIKIYASGDTSKTNQMSTFSKLNLDYAILCGDGIYNMGLEEASECARLINARHNLIIHLKPGALFDRNMAERWNAPNKMILEPNEEINL